MGTLLGSTHHPQVGPGVPHFPISCFPILLFYCFTVLLLSSFPAFLLSCFTVLLFYCFTAFLPSCFTVLLFYCFTVLLFYCFTAFLLSCFPVFLFSCFTVLLFYCFTAFLLYCFPDFLVCPMKRNQADWGHHRGPFPGGGPCGDPKIGFQVMGKSGTQ